MGDPVRELQERLSGGDVIIIDGGMGSELEARGLPMSSAVWSGEANLDHPDVVRAVHEDYIRAGADVIITNTFPTSRFAYAAAGLEGRFREVNERAVHLAREARENAAGGPVVIAGAMSQWGMPYIDRDGYRQEPGDPSEAEVYSAYLEHGSILAEAGADVILLECLEPQWMPALAAARDIGLPVWVGPTVELDAGGQLVDAIGKRPFREAFEPMHGPEVMAVTVMHSEIEAVVPALEEIRRQWSGHMGAYPHVGRFERPHWIPGNISPAAFAAHAASWVEAGARMVGGCCGIGPDHIRALKQRLGSDI